MELVKFDYERTLSFVDGVVRVSTGIRTVAITALFGLIAAAFQTSEWWLGAIAAAAVAALGLLDAYHGWLYSHASRRAYDMEKLLQEYYKFIQRSDFDPDIERDMLKGLHRHRFGQLANVPRFRLAALSEARPPFFYKALYPGLIVAAVLVAIGIALDNQRDDDGDPPAKQPPQLSRPADEAPRPKDSHRGLP